MSLFAALKRVFPYPLATLTVYWNSVFIGACMLILTLNADYLATRWALSDTSKIFVVISALGIGRCIGEICSGLFSDKFGRQLTLTIGCAIYALYMLSMIFAGSPEIAFAFTLIAGVGHAFIDNAAYPTLAESVPSCPDCAAVALKIFISLGGLLVPLLLTFILHFHLSNALIFVFFFIFVCISIIGALFARFPQPNQVINKQGIVVEENERFKDVPKTWPEGIACIIVGATTYSTFYIAQQSLNAIGLHLGMSDIDSAHLLSLYSTGAICAVITLIVILRRIRPIILFLTFPLCSMAASLSLYIIQTPDIARISAFCIGFFSAGGLFQLAISTIIELFPKRKGFYGSLVSFGAAFLMFITANAVGYYVKTDVIQLLLICAALTALSWFCALILGYRYRKIMH